ncbi:multiple sugar transport system substrate-binding protein [Arthrobacter sp. 1088]|uniref:ABC transporter substrate-binding protein n=1 Tax=Arthrobacter sp. 1088 TaxID=2817768 RepID=UPI0028572764|nr:sugar ABC transporter substrate-binding protein [Arthrobacter sp. 1088]MDR6688525.1 multiple sugar transport system substrate-binding protein [Arthrobacter sp. 1088]
MPKKILAAAAIIASAVALSGCSDGGNASAKSGVPTDKPITLTVWSWDGTVKEAVTGFEKLHPNITVNVVNAGSSTDEYTALDNAIQAGSGVPDIAMFEYFSLPLFAIPGKLTDLSPYGAQDLASDYVDAAWGNVTIDGKPYALPSDYGPAAMFYNQSVLAQAGVPAPPTTWDEFYQAAKKVRALGGDHYITNDSADIFLLMSLMWEGGGHPFKVNGTEVTIDFNDAGSSRAVAFWQKLLDEDLVNTKVTNWSDDWNRGLNEGTLATQLIGGWFTSTLPERAPDAAGNFRVAPLPQWEAGEKSGGENGGSAMAIPAAAQNKEAAYAFLEYFTHGDGLQPRIDAGAFVPNLSNLNSEAFLSKTNPFFGDQKYNQVLADASKNVATGWQYPPFFGWARSSYEDVAAPLYDSRQGTLAEVLETWKKRSIEYGNEQGFSVR